MAAKMKYEDYIEKIECIIDKLKSPTLHLEESIKEYEVALKYLKKCDAILNESQAKFEEINDTI